MEGKSFSSEYWNLHRNSLLFSSALFVVAISSKSGEFEIFGMAFEQVGTRAFVLLLGLAATYAITVFLLEWLTECWPSVQSETLKLRETRRAMLESATKMTNSLGGISALVDDYKDIAEKMNNGDIPINHNLIEKMISVSTSETLTWKINDVSNLHGEKTKDEVSIIADEWMASSYHTIDRMRSAASRMIPEETYKFREHISNIEKTLTFIRIDVATASSAMKRLPSQLIRPFSLSMTRGLLMAALVPAFAYTVAIAHALWQLGLQWFGSPLVVWLRG